jgi:hydroxylamine reductase
MTRFVDDWVQLTLRTGEFGVKAMTLLDEANTSRYGKPEITQVNLGVRDNPAILISGHDLTDLEQLLEQTQGTGVDVYTHSEMLPGHYYPAFKKYENFVGNYGNAWCMQLKEFETFHGPILFTTNCYCVPPRSEDDPPAHLHHQLCRYPGCRHIEADAQGHKDILTRLYAMANTLPSPEERDSSKGRPHRRYLRHDSSGSH